MNREDFTRDGRTFIGFGEDHEQTVISYTDDEVAVSVSKTRYSDITLLRFRVVDGKIVMEEGQWDSL